ncbi:aldehyde dehydrogenase family protein [Arhodomonas aquaeolei]|uniref:aldehyde dehydrogenase family protein n=1 Tax=Arhodomonas aquaeolei TaxID=2369 RepID=UPI00036607D3|nr:aldehyde dehydrogenase family protein [Arhodomonas aquaeolei]
MTQAAEQQSVFAGVSAAARAFVEREHGHYIGGEWVGASGGERLPVHDPATGTVMTRVAGGQGADVDRAVSAARHAFEDAEWSRMRPVDRERLLFRLADAIEAHADELAEIESLDQGKAVGMARNLDLTMAVDFVRYMAGWATKIDGRSVQPSVPYLPDQQFTGWTRKEPVGVVGAIVPWNFPVLMAVWKLAPALATGCTAVLKPAEETPLSALRLAELAESVGTPAGVINVVTGEGHTAGAALSGHPGIDKVAFTGSTEVGKLIGKAAMDNMTRVSLELGGKSPVVVLDDMDPAAAAQGAAQAIFLNHGQVCTAGSRLYVHSRQYGAVVDGLAGIAGGMRLGSGRDPQAQMGPLVSREQQQRVAGYIDSGREQGARVAAGGHTREGGYFVEPTILADTNHDMRVVREEIFGPVLTVMPYDDLDEVARLANDTPYGLGASIWSNDLSRVHRLIPKIRAGTVWVNCHNVLDPALPLGGFKQSGIGRELGREVVDLYTETKTVMMSI